MTRTLKDFTPGERNAYVVWTQKLSDHTLTKAEHEVARHELDKLFRRGPFGELETLKSEVEYLTAAHFTLAERVEKLEEFILVSRNTTSFEFSNPPTIRHPGIPAAPNSPVDAKIELRSKVVHADCGNQLNSKQTVDASTGPASAEQPEMDASAEATENRGRPKLRFHPEKDVNKQWHVLDREAGAYTSHGPYKTRREAKEMADTLNNLPNASPSTVREPLETVFVAPASSVPAPAPAPAPAPETVRGENEVIVDEVDPLADEAPDRFLF